MTSRDKVPARTVWRGILYTAITAGLVAVLVGALTSNEALRHAGESMWVTSAVLLLWSWTEEHRERIKELERRDQHRWDTDKAHNARLVELMDSAWRNDPTYREQRTKREAQEKYMRELMKENGK